MDHSECQNCLSRRQFIGTTAKVLGAAALVVPGAALLSGCGKNGSSASNLPVIPNSPSNVYTFNFSDYPALQNAGGAILVQVSATSASTPVAIVRTGTSTVAALNATCTHAGCTVNPYDAGAQTFTCACHGSVFKQDGSVANGPASQPLKTYVAQLGASSITATIP